MRIFIIGLGFLSVLAFSGCGYKQGVSTAAQESYLYFSGDTSNITVAIDGAQQFTVKPGRDNRYKVAPGKHLIHVYRDGEIVVEREVYVGDGIAKEIGVD